MIRIYDTNKILGSKIIPLSNFLLKEININLNNEFKKAIKGKKKIVIPHVVSKEISGRLDAYKDWLGDMVTDQIILRRIVAKIDEWIQYFQYSERLLYSNFWNSGNKFILKLIYEDSFNKTKMLLKSEDKNKKISKDSSIIKDEIILRELQNVSNSWKGQHVFVSADNYFKDKMEDIGIELLCFSQDDNKSPFNYMHADVAENLNLQIYNKLKRFYYYEYYGQYIEIDNDWNYVDFIADKRKAIKDVSIDVRVWYGDLNDYFGPRNGPPGFYESLIVKIIFKDNNWKIYSINDKNGRNYYPTNI